MAQGITFDINARVTGYEASLEQMKRAFSKLDPGSEIGQKLGKAIKVVDDQLKGLQKNLSPRATSHTQLDGIVEKVNKVGDSILNVAALMQTITSSDLNFDQFGDEIQKLRQQIGALENELENKLSAGLQTFAEQSDTVKNVFDNILKIDTTGKGPTELFQSLSDGAKKAAADTRAAEKELDKLRNNRTEQESKLQDLSEGPLSSASNRNQLQDQVRALKAEYDAVFSDLKTKLTKSLKDKLKDNSDINADEILNNFFKGLTPENITKKIDEMYAALKTDKIYTRKADMYSDLFGGGRTVNDVAKNINLGDPKPIIEKYQALIQSISVGLSGKEQSQLEEILTQDVDKFVNNILVKINTAYGKVQNAIKNHKDAIQDLLKKEGVQEGKVDTAKATEDAIRAATDTLRKELENLRQQYANLQNQINELRGQSTAVQEGHVNEIKQQTSNAGKEASGFKITSAEAEKYSAQLDQIHEKEKLVGKIEGVVQRWFSIYAAVRMVGNAINSVISTLKELDATITEIAIVTDMTQQDLWGQMSAYTDMARQYASSISGVYKVSQLYYQQGLQTAEVMSLTEQTLKMARISGLDYATATDYMTNAIRSFKMEMSEAQTVVDVYSAVAAASATDTTELASAMSKTASSAEAVGSSFENTTAMMAVMIEATRESAENIGSAMKSIISRYGEMTSDPTKLMDSEGQEMSLNRVDKALQTVGISIHDAAGQFRDFDDVIMELAASWDSIDKNTQRYIATIMAGNRQQSRFLALVSSYDRLKELSATAAESEDAAQLQFLKTLDSIDAKTQQLQTSMQALYVDSGLENFYKGLLDLGNNVVQTFTDMPKAFNLPILAIGKFSSQFYTLATVVVNAFSMIKAGLSKSEKEITLLRKAADGEQLNAAEQEALQEILIEKNKQKSLLEEQEKGQEAILNSQREHNDEQIAEAKEAAERQKEAAKQQYNRRQRMSKTGMALSAASLITSGIAANVDVNTNRGLKTGLTGASAALQGIGTFLSTGNIALAALTALPGIIETIGMASESVEEKVNRLGQAIEDTSNKKIQSKDELKTLTDYKKRYEELYKVRNKDQESHEEWLQLNSEIAAKYPELISYIDSEGNSIVALTNAYDNLVTAKQNAYKSDFLAEAQAQIKAANDIDFVLDQLNIDSTGKNARTNWANAGEANNYLSAITQALASGQNIVEAINAGNEAVRMTNTGYSIIHSLLGEGSITTKRNGWGQNIAKIANDKKLAIDVANGIQGDVSDYSDFIADILTQIIKNNLSEEELNEYLNSDIVDYGENLSINHEVYENIKQIGAAAEYTSEYGDKIIESYNKQAIDLYSSILEIEEESQIVLDQVDNIVQADWKQYRADHMDVDIETAWGNYFTQLSGSIKDTFTASEHIFDGVAEKNRKEIDQRYQQLEKQVVSYDRETRTVDGSLFNILRDMGASDDLIAAFEQKWRDEIWERRNDFINYINSLKKDSKGVTHGYLNLDQILNNIAPEFWDVIQSQLEQAYINVDTNPNEAQKQAEAISNIWQEIGKLSEIDKAIASSHMQNADLTSLTGIYNFIADLQQAGLSLDATPLKAALLSLGNILSINIASEFDSYINSISSSMEEFEKVLSSASKGMDLKAATELADRLKISITDFDFINGKFFYSNIEQIEEAYLNYNDELKQALVNRYNIYQNDFYEALQHGYQGTFSDYLKSENIVDLEENLTQIDEYSEHLIQQAYISANYPLEAIIHALKQTGDFNEEDLSTKASAQLQNILKGNFEEVNEVLWPYIPDILKNYSSSISSTIGEIGKSLGGEQIVVKVDQYNKELLKNFIPDLQDTASEVVLNLADRTYEEAKAIITGMGYSSQETESYLSTLYNEKYKDIIPNLLESAIGDYKGISDVDYQKLLSHDIDLKGTWNEALGTWVVDLDRLRKEVLNPENLIPQELQNTLLSQIDKEQHEISSEQIIRELIANRQSLSEDNIASLANLLNTNYEAVKACLYQNADGSYSISLESLRALIASANQDISNIIFSDVVGAQLDNAITAFSNLAKNQQQGITSAEEMQKQYQNLVQRGYTGSINSIFEFDEGLHAYRYSTEGLLLQIDYIQQELQGLTEDEQAIADSLISETKRQFAEQIDVDGLLSALGTSQETLAKQTFENTIKDYNAVVQALGETDFLPDANQLITALAAGGAQGISALTAIAKAQGKTVTSEQATAAYRNEVDRYINALDQLTAAPGEIIDSTAAEILAIAGGAASELGNSGAYVVTKSADLYAAYKNLLLELGRNGEATLAELNKVAALAIGAKDGEQQAIDALSNAANMTYEQLGEIFTAEGLQLTEQIVEQFTKSGIIEHLGGNKMAITDFARFADAMGWQADSPEYVSAFKSYNDSMIELNRRTEQNILDEAKNAMSAKQGDWINVTQLSKALNDKLLLDNYQKQLMAFGAYIDDGILKIADNANILGIAQTIQAAAEASGGLISSELAELADAIAEALANYAQLISGGIKGNLNNSQANQLQSFADQYNVGKLDFHETAEGLKLSNDSAINLYNTIKSIDTIQGQIVFNDLRSSLESSNEGLANISATSATIARTQETINKNLAEIRALEAQGSTSNRADQLRAENKQLEEQLSLYREIAVAQSSDSKSFDFMNRDLPDALNGPMNYWNSVGKAYTAMNEAASSGYMAIDDFYNIVNEMSNLAAMSGSTLEFMGQEIDGSAETAAALINKGLGALSNIDGKGVKIDLSKLGVDLMAGADGMSKGFHEGVKAMAKSQIEMLDAAIQMLEAIVAMEELGKIDIDKDNTLDLGEIFNLETDVEGDFTQAYTDWADTVLKNAETNEDLKKALNSISVNGRTLEEMIKVASSAVEDQAEAFKELNMTEEEYRTVIDAFYQAAINGDYDLDHIQQSVWEILERTLPDGTVIDIGDRTVTISGGTTTVIDWSSETTQQIVENLFHETDIEKQKAIYKQAITDFSEGNATTEQVELILTLAMHFKTVIDEETGKTTYEVDGRSFTNKTEAMAAAILANRGENIDQIETINDASGISAVVKKRVNGIKYEIHADASGKMSYVYNGQEYSTLDDVASQIANERFAKYSGSGKFEASSSQSLFTAADQTGASQTGADFALQKKLLADVKIELGLANPEATATTAVSELEQQITNAITAAFQNESVGQSITEAITTGIENSLTSASVPVTVGDVEVTDIEKSHYDSTLKLTEDIENGEANVTTMTVNATNFQAGGILQALQGFGFVTTSLALTGIAGSLSSISKTSFDNISNLSSLFGSIQDQVNAIWQTVQNFANKTFTVNMVTTSGTVTSGGGSSKGGKIGNGTSTSLTTGMDSGGVKSASNGTKTVVSSVKAPSIDTSEFNAALSDLSRMLHSTGSAIDSFKGKIDLLKSTIDSIKSTPVTNLATAMGKISEKSSAADALSRAASAMRNIPTGTKSLNIRFDYTVSKNGASATGSNSLFTAGGPGGARGNIAFAKGNSALAAGRQRTLMGELGPELVVTNGSYYVVGESGAEFVDLENDAIVFNHRQTKRLLTNGAIGSRGRPFTNETNAISFAKGTFGPARQGGNSIDTAAEAVIRNDIQNNRNQSTRTNIAKIIKPTNKTITESIRSISVSPKRHELKLYSMAKGSKNAGPAMASASAALALLKQLRAMWQSMLNASSRDLGSQAGRHGGGGGGGGGGGSTDPVKLKSVLGDIERWYNLIRQIDKLEKDITYQENLQSKILSDRVINGKALYSSYKTEIDYLDQEIARSQTLADLQRRWYDEKRKEYNDSFFGKIYTYDENGLRQMTVGGPGSGTGLDILETLNRKENGKPVMNAVEQLQYLTGLGLDIGELLYNEDGTQIATISGSGANLKITSAEQGDNQEQLDADAAAEIMERFWDEIDSRGEELDSIYDSIQDQLNNVLEKEAQRNALLQKLVDNQLSVEQDIYNAIVDREQAVIDELQKERDALEKASTKFIDGLNKSLNKEREMYQRNQDALELTKMQRQLAILQRSGGSASQIRNLQQQISDKQREEYFDEQERQINAIQEASDLEIERLDAQLDLMSETLEYQKKYGLLWEEVYEIMAKAPQEIMDFIKTYSNEFKSNSALQNSENLRDIGSRIDQWTEYRDDAKKGTDPITKNQTHGWDNYLANIDKERYKDVMNEETIAAARKAYEEAYATTSDPNQASAAANKVLEDALRQYNERNKPTTTNTNTNTTNTPQQEQTQTTPVEEKPAEGKKAKINQSSTTYYSKKADGSFKELGYLSNKKNEEIEVLEEDVGKYGNKTVSKIRWNGKEYYIRKERIKFKEGGLIDFTGPAWVDGSPQHPEGILDAESTRILREGFLSNASKNVEGLLEKIATEFSSITNASSALINNQTEGSIIIEKAEVNMNVNSIANDYDAKRAGEQALEEMLSIARKSGTRGISRR